MIARDPLLSADGYAAFYSCLLAEIRDWRATYVDRMIDQGCVRRFC